MKTLNPVDKEALYVGGSYLLAPVLSIMVAMPIYWWTHHAVAALTAGSLAGIGLYIFSCIRSPDGSLAARAADDARAREDARAADDARARSTAQLHT